MFYMDESAREASEEEVDLKPTGDDADGAGAEPRDVPSTAPSGASTGDRPIGSEAPEAEPGDEALASPEDDPEAYEDDLDPIGDGRDVRRY